MRGEEERSYWSATARHGAAYGALVGDIEADVAIVGAGFTGLTAAWHAARFGLRCALLEARTIGFGASGRTGGIVVPRYKMTFPELESRYGADTAVRMYRLVHEAHELLRTTIAEVGVDVGYSAPGHLTPIEKTAAIARFEADVRWLQTRVGDRNPRVLDAAQAATAVGSDFYRAAYLEPRGGSLHPLEYCQALARATASRGVSVFEHTPALEWSRGDGAVIVTTPKGRVRARRLILATNGYSDTTAAGARLKRRVVPVASALIATAPLPASVLASVLPGGLAATDAKRLTNYYRRMPDGRLLFGGRGGAFRGHSQTALDTLRRDLARIYPAVGNVAIEYAWHGLVAVTLDGLPHLGTLADDVAFAIGYNGRGVVLTGLLGRALARWAAGEAGDALDVGAMNGSSFDPIPFHALRLPAKQAAIAWFKVLDRLGA